MQSTIELLKSSDPDIHAAMIGEEQRQREGLELIPSENYAFPEVYVDERQRLREQICGGLSRTPLLRRTGIYGLY